MPDKRNRKATVSVALLVFGLLASGAAAQQGLDEGPQPGLIVSPQGTAFNKAWRWAEFTTESGLPSNRIVDIVETGNGTPWVSTQRGVAWFNGFYWNPLGLEHGIPTTAPRAITSYGADEILAVIEYRLFRGNQGHFYEVSVEIDGAPHRPVTLIPGPSGTAVVLAAKDRNAQVHPYLYRDNRFERLPPTARLGLEHENIEGWGTQSGAVWLNTLTGLARWDGERWETRIPAPASGALSVTGLVESPGGESGLAAITHPFEALGLWEWGAADPPRLNPAEPSDLFEAMDISPRGDAIVVYRSDDVRLRRDGVWSALEPVPPQMANATVVKHRQDGDLWVGTRRGLFLFRASFDRWTHVELESPNAKNVINGLMLARDGSLWLATGRGVVVHRPDGSVDSIEQILGEELLGTTGLAEDKDGGVWVSSGAAFEGAYRWDGTRWWHFGAADGLAAERIHKIRKDRSGRLWFLGMSPATGFDVILSQPGAFVYDGDTFEPWGPEQGLLHGRVYDFAEASDGTLWFATLRGLSRWRGGTWKHWTMDEGLRRGRIFTIALDHDDRLWFGDQASGLGYIRDEQPDYLTTANSGLINDEVQEIRVGAQGELWISTKGGLARLQDGDWLQFDTVAGISDPHLWPILPIEGAVYVGTSGSGVDILSLAEATSPAPLVRLEAPRVEENSVLLRWDTFAHWGQIAPDVIETRYRHASDQDWSEWDTTREVELTDLSSGQYVFEVQAKGLFGSFESPGASTPFTIDPPLHLRPGFFVPVGALGFLVVALLATIVVRRRRLTTALREHEDDYRRQLEQRVEKRTVELRESEERLRLLLETTHVIPWEADAQSWEFTYVGPQAVSILGYPVEEWYEPDFFVSHVHPDDVEAASIMARYAATEQRYELEYRMIAADGSVVWLHDIATVISESDLPITARGFMIDITQRVHADAERRDTEAELLEHRERLAHMSRVNMLGEMATGIAHEVNQPLTAVSSYTQACRRMIEAGMMDQQQLLDVLSRISDEAVRAGDMIHGLKALVRKRPSELGVCDVNDLIRDVVRLAEVEARDQGVEIQLDLQESVSPIVVDAVQIQQVVLNLVRNAIEAAEGEPGQVRIRTFENGNDGVEIEVIDSGTGVDDESERLFQPFFSTKGSGMGMGLAISRNIVEAHGGEIGLRDADAGGSTFYFTLPTESRDFETG